MNRARYIAVRAGYTLVLLWMIVTALYLLFKLLPGNFITLLIQGGADPETVALIREKWGLNEPIYIQYWSFMINFITLEFGNSLQAGVPVITYVKAKILNSFILVAPAITAAFVFGGFLGAVAGTKRGSRLERSLTTSLIMIGGIPSFFLGILAIIIFASGLGWFPSSGMLSAKTAIAMSDAPWWRPYLTLDFAHHYILPFLVIFVRYLYFPFLLMRTNIIEVMGQDHFFFHRMTGLSKPSQLRHLTKHASLPVITMYPISLSRSIGGLVLVEVVFDWPGVGHTLVQSVVTRDLPVAIFIFFLVSAFVVVGNFVVDIIYSWIDPRVRVGGEDAV